VRTRRAECFEPTMWESCCLPGSSSGVKYTNMADVVGCRAQRLQPMHAALRRKMLHASNPQWWSYWRSCCIRSSEAGDCAGACGYLDC
jgi:hypothetical protein